MWEGSVLRYSQAGACKPLPGDSVFQRLKTAALHTCPGLHSALATTMLWCLSHPSLFEQVRHTKVHLLHHPDLCDLSLVFTHSHPGISALLQLLLPCPDHPWWAALLYIMEERLQEL